MKDAVLEHRTASFLLENGNPVIKANITNRGVKERGNG